MNMLKMIQREVYATNYSSNLLESLMTAYLALNSSEFKSESIKVSYDDYKYVVSGKLFNHYEYKVEGDSILFPSEAVKRFFMENILPVNIESSLDYELENLGVTVNLTIEKDSDDNITFNPIIFILFTGNVNKEDKYARTNKGSARIVFKEVLKSSLKYVLNDTYISFSGADKGLDKVYSKFIHRLNSIDGITAFEDEDDCYVLVNDSLRNYLDL